MSRRVIALACLAALALALAAAGAAGGGAGVAVVRVIDGDTIEVSGDARVRLVQIDAPEVGSGECYSRASARVLRSLLPVGVRVRLERDARLDATDSFGRLLRYVHRGRTNVNLELVRRGAATIWFYDGDRGRYARALLAAGRGARVAKRGLWGACRAVWDPHGPATTAPRGRGGGGGHGGGGGRCDASYPDFCIPPPPPDLDCADVPRKGFRVVGADPHRFDGDGDGVGCE